jgi:hypothetical protein
MVAASGQGFGVTAGVEYALFPMWDGGGSLCGYSRRYRDGKKSWGRNGLFLPAHDPGGPMVLVVEGASDVVLAGGRGEQATSATALRITDLVAVASLDWAHAEALGRACAEMLTSSAQTIVWRVCTEAEAAEGMEVWQYETLRSRARERGMIVAPCDELSCLGVLLVAVGASSITLATSPLGRAFSTCEVWRERARATGANGDGGDGGASARGTTAVAAT